MARGNWSFLHEWVMYDYLMARYEEKNLRLKCIAESGNIVRRERWISVTELKPIMRTDFPDIDYIKLKGSNKIRQAEVKFITSTFRYHIDNKFRRKYSEFINNGGFILVLNHDYLPSKLGNIDVYEIDQSDFSAFCRENFNRLLNRQIKSHTEAKIWIMYQGPNFNEGDPKLGIKPARDSGIWCPTENLTGFDLAPEDRVLFIRTGGASTQEVQKQFLDSQKISYYWFLKEIFIGVIKSKIFSRKEYCDIKKLDYDTKRLWKNDSIKGGYWRWNRVFEFKPINTVSRNIKMKEIYNNEFTKGFVEAAIETYCFRKSRELNLKEYQQMLEVLT